MNTENTVDSTKYLETDVTAVIQSSFIIYRFLSEILREDIIEQPDKKMLRRYICFVDRRPGVSAGGAFRNVSGL